MPEVAQPLEEKIKSGRLKYKIIFGFMTLGVLLLGFFWVLAILKNTNKQEGSYAESDAIYVVKENGDESKEKESEKDKDKLSPEELAKLGICQGNKISVKVVDDTTQAISWECRDPDEYVVEYVETFAEMNCGCEEVYTPVCSTDYYTMHNTCVAECKGKEVAHEGECQIYSSEVLPEGCQPCEVECSDVDEFFPKQKDGCPYCVCRSLGDSWYDIYAE